MTIIKTSHSVPCAGRPNQYHGARQRGRHENQPRDPRMLNERSKGKTQEQAAACASSPMNGQETSPITSEKWERHRNRRHVVGVLVHPYVRGDGCPECGIEPFEEGSPPRAWGRQYSMASLRCERRFTPTCVGTAFAQLRSDDQMSVHPHVRGDGVLAPPALWSFIGSPPRAWGRRAPAWGRNKRVRFTPTCVGTAR